MLRAKYLQPGLRRTEAAQFDFDKGLICFFFFFLRQKGWLNLLWRSQTQPHSRTVYTATQTCCTWSRLHTVNAHMWPCTAGIHTCSVHMLVKGKKNQNWIVEKSRESVYRWKGMSKQCHFCARLLWLPKVRVSSSPIGGWSEATMAARKKV